MIMSVMSKILKWMHFIEVDQNKAKCNISTGFGGNLEFESTVK